MIKIEITIKDFFTFRFNNYQNGSQPAKRVMQGSKLMFIHHTKVRMNDTDTAGVLFFANQFRFVHDAFEEYAESLGLGFAKVLKEKPYLFVIRHAEAEYLLPLGVGDDIKVELSIERVGESSFSVSYRLFSQEQLIGTAKTTHVTLDKASRKKIRLPDEIRSLLELQSRG